MTNPPDISGNWTSVAREPMGTHWATRNFVIDAEHWSVVYRAWADAEGEVPLFTLEVGGVYVLGGPSQTVDGAFDGVFPQQRRSVKIDSDAGAAMFAAMGAEVKAGERRDLTAQRLGFLPCIMEAMGEYDLVAMHGDKFFFGHRSGDMSRARPERLTDFPMQRAA